MRLLSEVHEGKPQIGEQFLRYTAPAGVVAWPSNLRTGASAILKTRVARDRGWPTSNRITTPAAGHGASRTNWAPLVPGSSDAAQASPPPAAGFRAMPSDAPTRSVAVGHALNADSRVAARMAARDARQQMPPNHQPSWLLVFAGGQHEPDALLAGLREELGPLPVVGGCGAGLISVAGASATGYECGILLFSSALEPTAILCVDGLDHDETDAGCRLGGRLRDLDLPPRAVVLLFYDSIRSAPPPVLHVGSRLLEGLYEGLRGHQPLVIGAGTLADVELSTSYVFDGQQAVRHSAVAVVLPPSIAADHTIMHGCLPASDFLQITKIDGARVLELDGRPALSLVAERLGLPRAALLARQPLPSLTLGEKLGDRYAPFNDSQYVNRLVIALDPADEALVLFEADFEVGSRVQLMSYEPDRMIESAAAQTQRLLATTDRDAVLCGIYIDCAGRSMAFSGMEEDESAPVRQQIGALCPFLGFYSGVEIAPFQGRARPLDWTGVLLLLSHRG
ncbi:hypothetical protein CKO22_02360 [Thiococcus pfennigii]|nr:hypothetical protein [Thiococcus pfennigii]